MMNRFLAISLVVLVLLPGKAAALVRRPIPRDSDQEAHLQRFEDYRPALVTTVYARDGSILGYFFRKKRFYRALSSMPPYLTKAFLAAEDKAFYEHDGVDPSAIFRAFFRNIEAGDIVQGGSTITQQLVKRVMLTSEKSYSRKFKEAILAYRLERHMTKAQILTLYLNETFFGDGAYGVEAAARGYFGKTVKKLTLAESALLAGLLKAPSASNPFRSPQKAKARQRYVLGRMLALDWITDKEHEQALKEKLEYKSMQDPSWKLGAYYLEEVRRWLIKNMSEEKMKALGLVLPRYGEDAVFESGLHVYTALSPDHQRAAEKALRRGLEESARRRGWTGPIKRIKTAEHEAYLQAQAKTFTPGQRFKPGDWTQVLVIRVTAGGAEVRMGSLSGFISVRTMGWCRKPNPEVTPESVAQIRDARQVVRKGDVVWAKVIAVTAKRLSLALARRPEIQGALISMDPRNGEVLAMVGGYDFSSSQFNRATQAKRQPGSLFKPIVFSAAIDNGYTAATLIPDKPWSIVDPNTSKTWAPRNFSGNFYGPTLLCTALVQSRNVVVARIAKRMGMGKVVKRAKKMGIFRRLPLFPAVSLGAAEVTPLDMTRVYSTFARSGTRIGPRLVLSVRDREGKEILHTEPRIARAVSPQNAYIITHLLKHVVQYGTARRARVLNRPVAAKTGTTNDTRDAWFIGFTPYLLTTVYVGFDQGKSMGKEETGSRAAGPIWVKYRLAIEKRYRAKDFPIPRNIVFEQVSGDGEYLAPDFQKSGIHLPFLRGTQPSLMHLIREPIRRSTQPGLIHPAGANVSSPTRKQHTIFIDSQYQKEIVEISKKQ